MRRTKYLVAAVVLCACASSQPRVCSLSSVEMKNEQRDALVAATCAPEEKLAQCADARRINAKWAALWDEWEQCRH